MSRLVLPTLLLLFAFSGGCSPQPPVVTPTLTLTPTPEPTLSPTSTHIPTPSPVPWPQEILEQLDLQSDRTYVTEGNYYVDTYNGAKLACYEPGGWRLTTVEEKYGHLVPADMAERYPVFVNVFEGDEYEIGHGIKTVMLQGIYWTGDYLERQADYDGVKVTELDGIFAARDNNGKLYQLRVRLYSPDVPGVFEIFVATQIDEKGIARDRSYNVGKPEDFLSLGSRLDIPFYSVLPEGILEPHFCDQFGDCSDQVNAARYAYWEQAGLPEYMDQVTAAQDVLDPGGLVLIPSWQMTIYPPGR